MPDEPPCMLTVGNLDAILEKIEFTHDLLKTILGFTASRDRAVIRVLRQLGFLNSNRQPTNRYNEFRHALLLAGLWLRERDTGHAPYRH